ncbi:hypothetical protein CR513_15387, partial [Mucuna pruriens]
MSAVVDGARSRIPLFFHTLKRVKACPYIHARQGGAMGNEFAVWRESPKTLRCLRLGALEPTSIVMQLENRSIIHPLGILEDVSVQVNVDVHAEILSMEFADNLVEHIIFEAMKHLIKNPSVFYLDVINQLECKSSSVEEFDRISLDVLDCAILAQTSSTIRHSNLFLNSEIPPYIQEQDPYKESCQPKPRKLNYTTRFIMHWFKNQ